MDAGVNLERRTVVERVRAIGHNANESLHHAVQVVHVQIEQCVAFDDDIADDTVVADFIRKANRFQLRLRRYVGLLEHCARIHDHFGLVVQWTHLCEFQYQYQ